MGVIRILFLTLVYISPLYAYSRAEYELCVQQNNSFACQHAILDGRLSPQERDNVRELLDPSYVSRVLSYLQEDADGFLALLPYTDKNLVLPQYRMCVDNDNLYSCEVIIVNDLLTSEQRRNVRRKLENLNPQYIGILVEFLTGRPRPQIAQANPQPQQTPSDSCQPGFTKSKDGVCQRELALEQTPQPQTAQPAAQFNTKEQVSSCLSRSIDLSCVIALRDPTISPETRKAVQDKLDYLKSGPSDLTKFLIFCGVVAGIIVLISYARRRIREHNQRELNAMPEQPFKVNVTVKPIEASKILNVVRGRALTHGLDVDVTIGPKDWDRIKKAGLYDAVLFDFPDCTSTFSGERDLYRVSHLRSPGGAAFYNINDAYEARDKLINALHDIKATIEVQKEGKQVTEFEI
jgi:hypothetical protein